MYKEKPYSPVLIVNLHDKNYELDPGQGLAVALEIRPGEQEINKSITNLLINSDLPFLILIDGQEQASFSGFTQEITDLIILCLFSKSYIRQGDTPVVAFTRTGVPSSDAADEYILSLITHLQLQGWPVISRWDLPLSLSFREQVLRKSGGPFLLRNLDIDEEFLLNHFFTDPSYPGSYIFFRGQGPDGSRALEKGFFTLCQTILNNRPTFGQYLFHYLEMKRQAEESYKERKVLQERLGNAEMTIDIIKSKYKDDYDLLFRWYHNEYEILPLWYKRFGHILKVLTGRRTFKSLFQDDKNKHMNDENKSK
jgi:hypothetical protein